MCVYVYVYVYVCAFVCVLCCMFMRVYARVCYVVVSMCFAFSCCCYDVCLQATAEARAQAAERGLVRINFSCVCLCRACTYPHVLTDQYIHAYVCSLSQFAVHVLPACIEVAITHGTRTHCCGLFCEVCVCVLKVTTCACILVRAGVDAVCVVSS